MHPHRRENKSLLAYALDTLDDDTFHRVKATGIAAGVVVGRVLGLTVKSAYCVRVRFDGLGGSISVAAESSISVQHLAVHYLACPQGSSRALPADAHPLAAAAVEEITGQDNLRSVLDLLDQGYAVWRRQAEIDVALLLNEPLVWNAVCEVADALINAGAPGLNQDRIEALVGLPSLLSGHQVWVPDLDGLDLL